MNELVRAVLESSKRLGISPSDVLTAMSYETGGTFNPNMWGGKNNNHLGLIQFGGPERAKYGVKPGMAVGDQVLAAENFLRDRGVKPGMGMLDIYSTINAGRPGLYNRSDARAGGMPGTVADKVSTQMVGHRLRAENMLKNFQNAAPADAVAQTAPPPSLPGALAQPPAPASTAAAFQAPAVEPTISAPATAPTGPSFGAGISGIMQMLGGGQQKPVEHAKIDYVDPNAMRQRLAAILAQNAMTAEEQETII